jgi:hypothetical protein
LQLVFGGFGGVDAEQLLEKWETSNERSREEPIKTAAAHIDALDVSCSGNHNALHKAKSRAKAFAGATHQQVTIQTL